MENRNEYLTEKEVEERYRISLSSLRRWRYARIGIPFIKAEGHVLYRSVDCEAYMTKNTVKVKVEA